MTTMPRPKPTISSANRYQDYFRQAQIFAERFAAQQGVVGVLVTGGLARGYADHFSELDLAVYLTRPAFEAWIHRGAAPFPEGDSCLEGWHVDFDYLCYEDELDNDWEHLKRWDRSYAISLHDPQGRMAEMLARKAVIIEGEITSLTRRYLVLYGEYFCNLVIPSWLQRGDVLAAHHCLNVALDNVIKTVFLANNELIPFEKWSLNLSYSLAWLPADWRERLEGALLVREISEADVGRRCDLLRALVSDCKERLLPGDESSLGSIEALKLEILRELRARGEMPAAEFDRRFDLRQAIRSPFFHLLRREARQGGEWLVFDEARLQKEAAQDFGGYLSWDQALLRALFD